MSTNPDGPKMERASVGKDASSELPAQLEPIHGKVAAWAPRIATAGVLGLNLWRAQQIPGPRGVAGLTFAYFGTSQWDRIAADHMASALASSLLIWTVEGYRATNSRSLLALPFAFGVSTQLFGLERVAPIYYIYSILAGNSTAVGREVEPYAAMAVLPATIVGHILPSLLMSTLPLTATEVSRSYFTLQSTVCYAFYFSPIIVSLLTRGVSAGVKWLKRRFGSEPAPINQIASVHDTQTSPDLAALRMAYSMMFVFQSAGHLLRAAESVRPTLEALEPFSWVDRIALLKAGIGPFGILRGTNQGRLFSSSSSSSAPTLFTLSTFAFLLYTVWDLRRRGYITNREAGKAFLSHSAGSALVGTGASYAGLWYWRETILHRMPNHSKPQSHVQD